MTATILVVDDKEMLRDSVGQTLRRAGFEVVAASDGASALRTVAERRPDAVVTDLKMPGMTGLELLDAVMQIDADLPVVLMTAFGTIETAVQAMRRGAFDYVTKPFEGDELVITVKRALAHGRLVKENAVLRAGGAASLGGASGMGNGAVAGRTGAGRLIGDSPVMRRLKEQLPAIATSQGTVLITGESGSGKEVVARAIHELSPRREGPFLAVNCAALSESLLESELFGHERGAFTGAEKLRKGRFELAHGGTLLLDEVSEVSPQIQAKLLRVLQERAFERVGSSITIGVDVRVVATSNKDLPEAVRKGEFRQDLFFRLNVLPVGLPALRGRSEDVPSLVGYFAAMVGAREGREAARFDDAALDLLCAYPWPGNVRELANIVERAVVLTGGMGEAVVRRELIEPWLIADVRATTAGEVEEQTAVGAAVGAWSRAVSGRRAVGSLAGSMVEGKVGDRTLADIEREAIVEALTRFNGHRAKTARALGIGVRTLGLKLKKWKEDALVPAGL